MTREEIVERLRKDGGKWMVIPSALPATDGSGKPEYEMVLSRTEMQDAGVASLHFRETRTGGFEYPSRKFLHSHLDPGDTFIDVGAHFGVYSLCAAKIHPGEVKVLAVEPHPVNMGRLRMWAEFNSCSENIMTAECATSAHSGYSLLLTDSSMGHRLSTPETRGTTSGSEPINVQVEPLDRLAAKAGIPDNDSRIILKIDTEGHELPTMLGALKLLKSGRVKAIIWEKGHYHIKGKGAEEFGEIMTLLRDLGYDSYRFPHEDMGGPLVPYVPSPESCNIISVDRDLKLLPVYEKPWSAHPVMPPSMRPNLSPEAYGKYTKALMEHKSTDCGRWSRWGSLYDEADLRCGVAARHIQGNSNVLDCGAGLTLLRDYIPESCSYTPLDIVARTRDTIVADLNQGHYPDADFDVVVALYLLEFLHEPEKFLKWAMDAGKQLLLAYAPAQKGSAEKRRRMGYFNDLNISELEKMLDKCGWKIRNAENLPPAMVIYNCERKDEK